MPEFINTQNKPSAPSEPNAAKKIDTAIYHTKPIPKKSPLLLRSVIVLVAVVLLIGIGFGIKMIRAINSSDASGKKIGILEQIKHLVTNPEKQLNGEENDRVNILLAGIGGAGHDGAYLADTIILVSIKPSTQEVATLSIPRDLYVEIPGYGWRKINNALAFGRESNYPGGGEALLAKVVENVTGQTVNYYARIDFDGFRQVIDDLGGIDVTIDNSFDDYEYPDYTHGYQHISFKTGTEHMTGERALQFVRSRHGTNGEGSDFARSRRQQKVLLAVKDKAFSLNTLANPASVVGVLNDVGSHNQTNLQIWEMLKLSKLVQNINKDKLITRTLDNGTEGLLKTATTADGAYILQPKSGNFLDIQYFAKNIFTSSYIAKENATIEIQNSTKVTSLGAKISEQLKTMQFNIESVSTLKNNSAYTTTTIYDLSNGKNPYTLQGLSDMLGGTIATTLPAFLTNTNTAITNQVFSNKNTTVQDKNADILIIIGSDLEKTTQLTSRAATTSIKKDL